MHPDTKTLNDIRAARNRCLQHLSSHPSHGWDKAADRLTEAINKIYEGWYSELCYGEK